MLDGRALYLAYISIKIMSENCSFAIIHLMWDLINFPIWFIASIEIAIATKWICTYGEYVTKNFLLSTLSLSLSLSLCGYRFWGCKEVFKISRTIGPWPRFTQVLFINLSDVYLDLNQSIQKQLKLRETSVFTNYQPREIA